MPTGSRGYYGRYGGAAVIQTPVERRCERCGVKYGEADGKTMCWADFMASATDSGFEVERETP